MSNTEANKSNTPIFAILLAVATTVLVTGQSVIDWKANSQREAQETAAFLVAEKQYWGDLEQLTDKLAKSCAENPSCVADAEAYQKLATEQAAERTKWHAYLKSGYRVAPPAPAAEKLDCMVRHPEYPGFLISGSCTGPHPVVPVMAGPDVEPWLRFTYPKGSVYLLEPDGARVRLIKQDTGQS